MPEFDRIVILTGAGISAESGVPTFRDKGGIWAKYDYRDVATPEGFEKNPQLVARVLQHAAAGASDGGAERSAFGAGRISNKRIPGP